MRRARAGDGVEHGRKVLHRRVEFPSEFSGERQAERQGPDNYALAHNFVYLVGMAVDNVVAVPGDGNVPMDGIVKAEPADVVVTMTFAPYRTEVVDATDAARRQGAQVVAITDSHGSPIAPGADHLILAPSATPQFFPSTLAAAAALEALVSFIVADAPPDVVAAIDLMHERRHDLGVYWRPDRGSH